MSVSESTVTVIVLTLFLLFIAAAVTAMVVAMVRDRRQEARDAVENAAVLKEARAWQADHQGRRSESHNLNNTGRGRHSRDESAVDPAEAAVDGIFSEAMTAEPKPAPAVGTARVTRTVWEEIDETRGILVRAAQTAMLRRVRS